MTTPLSTFAPRLLAGFGTAALVAGVGLFASSRPAHTAGGPIPVNVANTVQTTATDGPAKQPVRFAASLIGVVGEVATDAPYTVPAGKRLVIEYVSAKSNTNGDKNTYTVEVDAGSASYSSAFFNLGPSAAPFTAVSQPVRLYADAGTAVNVTLFPSRNNASDVTVSITGYLVDVP